MIESEEDSRRPRSATRDEGSLCDAGVYASMAVSGIRFGWVRGRRGCMEEMKELQRLRLVGCILQREADTQDSKVIEENESLYNQQKYPNKRQAYIPFRPFRPPFEAPPPCVRFPV